MAIDPNMNFDLPVVESTLGPDWANKLNEALTVVGEHDHSTGNGVKITPAGLNIISDLLMQGNDLDNARSLRMSSQSASITAPTDINCLYVLNGDLFYKNQSGTDVQVTSGGGLNFSSLGTIGGDFGQPGVTATVTYSDLTKIFAFNRTAGVGADVACSSIKISDPVLGSQTITIKPPAVVSAYNLTLPGAVPTVTDSIMKFNTSGVATYSSTGLMPVGSVVPSFPSLSGAYNCTATTVADSYGFVQCNGQTIADATSPMNGAVIPNINNDVFLMGNTTSGSVGGANVKSIAHSHNITSTSPGLPDHFHTLDANGGARLMWNNQISNVFTADIWTGGGTVNAGPIGAVGNSPSVSGGAAYSANIFGAQGGTWAATPLTGRTSSITSNPGITINSSSDSQLSASQDFRPSYISAKFIMRIK